MRRRARAVVASALGVVVLGVATGSCGGGGSSAAPDPTAASSSAAAGATAAPEGAGLSLTRPAERSGLSDDQLQASVSEDASATERDIWRFSGIDDAVGPAEADRLFAVQIELRSAFTASVSGATAALVERSAPPAIEAPAVDAPGQGAGADAVPGAESVPAPALGPGERGASAVVVNQPVSALAGSMAATVVPGQTLRDLFRLPAVDQGASNVEQFSDGSGSITTKVSPGEVSAESTFTSPKSTESDAVTVTMSIVAAACPAPDGSWEAKVRVGMKSRFGRFGRYDQSHDVTISGQTDDDTRVTSTSVSFRTEATSNVDAAAARAAGASDIKDVVGAYAEVEGSYQLPAPGVEAAGPATVVGSVRRASSKADQAFRSAVFNLGALASEFVARTFPQELQKSIESGRCVRLDTSVSNGPGRVSPGSTSEILAEPRSRLDGSPTGGTVIATLSGTSAVEPRSTKVKADARFTYSAPVKDDESGTVDLEARSRRGVGRASLEFNTRPASYLIVGGLEDWQVSQQVCDIMAPFELSSPVGTMKLSGGLSGTYTAEGLFNARYQGTYTITLPQGPGFPGTMTGTGSGTIAGQAGSGTETYTLTPVTC